MRIKKKLKQPPLRLLRAVAFAAVLMLIAAFLFKLDAFPRQRQRRQVQQLSHEEQQKEQQPDKSDISTQNQRRRMRGKDLLSPHHVLEQYNTKGGDSNAGDIKHRHHDSKMSTTRNKVEGNSEASSTLQHEPQIRRRYRMLLANLKSIAGKNDEGGGSGTGQVIIELRPDWAPIGVTHLEELFQALFYNQCRFFRVLPNFVVQFGIAADPAVHRHWEEKVLQDDPVLQTNRRGTLTYATSGKNTRTTQLFINTNGGKQGNAFLDAQGFAPVGQVLAGMEFIDRINDEYKEKPNQGKITQFGNEYLQKEFPRLSYIDSIEEITADGEEGAV